MPLSAAANTSAVIASSSVASVMAHSPSARSRRGGYVDADRDRGGARAGSRAWGGQHVGGGDFQLGVAALAERVEVERHRIVRAHADAIEQRARARIHLLDAKLKRGTVGQRD